MKKLLYLLCILVLVCSLFACAQAEDTPSETPSESVTTTQDPTTTAPQPTSEEPQPTSEVTEPTTEAAPVTTVPPISEGTPIDAEAIAWYQSLFTRQKDRYAKHPQNWYNLALCMQFDSPENIDWNVLFYNGIDGEDGALSDAEQTYLQQQGFPPEMDVKRIPADKMDAIAQQYFGVTLAESNQVGLEKLTYFAQTGCYYRFVSDTMSMDDFVIHSGFVLENGDIRLYYTYTILEQECVITLQSCLQEGETGYRILSNLPCEP